MSTKRPRPGSPLTPVEEVLGSVMRELQMPGDIQDKGKVFELWDRVAGEAAAWARPFRFRGSTLLVEVSEPAWLTELSMRRTDLVKRLEREVGEGVVREIRFEMKKKREE